MKKEIKREKERDRERVRGKQENKEREKVKEGKDDLQVFDIHDNYHNSSSHKLIFFS